MAIEFLRDGPWELPEGWVWTPLSSFLRNRGQSVDPARTPDTEYILYSVPSFEAGAPEMLLGRHIGSSKQRVSPGEVLLCKINPRINRSWIVRQHDKAQIIASTEWIVLDGQGAVEPEYLQWVLRQERVRIFLASNVSGVGGSLMRVKPSTIADFLIPIAPLAEQRRIVARIDALFTEIADGETALAKARDDLDTWRRALLKAAVTGELTREWRESNDPEETGKDLVARVREERARAGNGTNRSRRIEGEEAADEPLFDGLPDTWSSATFGELFNLFTGSTPSRSQPNYWRGNIPWVSSGEVAFCRIADTNERITEAGLAASSTRLHPVGTVLLAMIGEGKTRGQPAILDIEATNNQNAAAIRVSETSILPEFVFDFLAYRYEQTRRAGQGGNQPALNLGKVSQIRMPVPPLSEMREIVRLVKALGDEMGDIKGIPQAIGADAAKLRQSVLKSAFEGRLVEQDPRDEPADVMLTRLTQQTAATPMLTHGKRPRRAALAAE